MTTYIKRVPQFKAVQFQISKESYNAIRNLSRECWSDMNCKMISQMGRMTITFNADHNRIITASEGDWVVRELDGTLSVMTDEDFKAQYEAAPEAKVKMDELREEAKEKQRAADREGFGNKWRELMGQQPRAGLDKLNYAQFTTAGACIRPGESVDQANQRMNREMQQAAVSQVAGSKPNGWGLL